jgi:hypothetical protein
MTNVQLYLAIGIPIMANAALFGLFFVRIKARFDILNNNINQRFGALDQRFDDIRDL